MSFVKMNFLVVLLAVLVTSLYGDGCEDRLVNCPNYAANCGNDVIRTYCRRTCNDCGVDPCTTDNGGCDHLCNSTGGIAACSCSKGYKLADDGRTCTDIDECSEGPNPCYLGLPAFCVNTIGSFSCEAYSCEEQGTMNYYRSGQCCNLRNSTCGVSASIRNRIQEYNNEFFPAPTVMRVFGGVDAAMSAWPWMAQILFGGGAHCGASLVSDRWLVAAAHCFRGFSYQNMIVYMGQIRNAHLTHIDTSRREQRRISRVIIHEEFNNLYNNDIALVQLSEPVTFSDIISPICLPCGEVPNVGDKCWVTGFGQTESSGREASTTLQEVDVPIVEADDCVTAYEGIHEIIPDMMTCAGYPEGGRDACHGDSGGPLACQRADSCEWYLSGVTSFGRGCGVAGYYGVYTNVVNYEAWIRENMGDDANDLCSRRYNPCRRFTNIDEECYTKLDKCKSFPHYMQTNCRLACCQLENNEITNCFDEPESSSACRLYASECRNLVFRSFMETNCRKTCNFC